MNYNPPNDPSGHLLDFRRALFGAVDKHKNLNHHTLKFVLHSLYTDPGGRASVRHFISGRRGMPQAMWMRFKMSWTSYAAMPEQTKAELERLWMKTYKPPYRRPKDHAPTESFGAVLARWEAMVDQLAMELITPEQLKADMRAVLGRQGDRRRRL